MGRSWRLKAFNTLGRWYMAWHGKMLVEFQARVKQCQTVQRSTLAEKLKLNGGSDFGRRHGLHDVRNLEEFRRRMPLTTYEDYAEDIQKMLQGRHQALLGPGTRTLMFALSSGTTGEAKHIPVTPEFLKEYRRGWKLWGMQAYRDHPQARNQYNLQLSSDWRQYHTPGGTPCGNISGLATDSAPALLKTVYVLPSEVRRIADPFAKQYVVLRLALATPLVGMLLTANPSTVLGLCRMADQRKEELIRELRDGGLRADLPVSAEVRSALKRRLRPNPERAKELEQIVAETGRLLPKDYWPGMALLAVWTGGSVGAYLPALKPYFGDVPIRDHGLSASEGRMTLPLEDSVSAGVLDLDSHFFEFVPEEEHDSPRPSVLEAHELLEGRNYFIVLTTSSGLWRYDISDMVRCEGFMDSTPILRFLSKGRHFSNLTGEKLSEYQVVSAVSESFRRLGLSPEPFTVAPEWGDPPCYRLLVEDVLPSGTGQRLTRMVDARLREMNREYDDRLHTKRLSPLCLESLPPGAWSSFRHRRISLPGGSLEQYKHPCLVGDLSFLPNLRRDDQPLLTPHPL